MSSDDETEGPLRQYFSEEVWTEMSEYERMHYSSLRRNYKAMISAGLNPKPPHFMTAKPVLKSSNQNRIKFPKDDGISSEKSEQGIPRIPEEDDEISSKKSMQSISKVSEGFQASEKRGSGSRTQVCVDESKTVDKANSHRKARKQKNPWLTSDMLLILSKHFLELLDLILEPTEEDKKARELEISQLEILETIAEENAETLKLESGEDELSQAKELKPDKDELSEVKELGSGEDKLSEIKEVGFHEDELLEVEQLEPNEGELSEVKELGSGGNKLSEIKVLGFGEELSELKELVTIEREQSEKRKLESSAEEKLDTKEIEFVEGQKSGTKDLEPIEEQKSETKETETIKREKAEEKKLESSEEEKSEVQIFESREEEDKPKIKKRKSSKREKSVIKKQRHNEEEVPDDVQRRYPRRKVPRKNYKEPEELDDDDFLFCDDCNREYEGDCPIHEPLKFIANKKVPRDGSIPDRAFQTVPPGVSICPSSIKGAGRGAWADIPFKKGLVFGPYEGKMTRKIQEAQRSGYSWVIYKRGKPEKYIDAEDISRSNWLRFVNCAGCEERQNLIAFQYSGKIFYRTYKPIPLGTEFLVWYGTEYADELGLDTEEKDPSEVELNPVPQAHRCEKCHYLFATLQALLKHNTFNHRNRDNNNNSRHKCHYCPYATNYKTHLLQHQRTHTGEKPHKCPQCHKQFSLNSNLKRHMLHHTGQKPYSCDICCKTFSLKAHLTTHTSIHLKKKDHVCNFCAKTFNQRSSLQMHERTHTGQRPYKCDHCNARFNQSSSLNRHVIYKHTRKFPQKCIYCHKGFVRPNELRRHLRLHHSNEE